MVPRHERVDRALARPLLSGVHRHERADHPASAGVKQPFRSHGAFHASPTGDIKDRFPIVLHSALRATLGILERTALRTGLPSTPATRACARRRDRSRLRYKS